MHALAIAFGLFIHIWGDLFTVWAAAIVWRGRRNFMPDQFWDVRPRLELGGRMLPIPLALSAAGAAAVFWGVGGASLILP
jgi:hypothetical protein